MNRISQFFRKKFICDNSEIYLKLKECEGQTVSMKYNFMTGHRMCPHERSGILYSVTEEVAVFWPLNTSKAREYRIDFKDIEDVKLLNK